MYFTDFDIKDGKKGAIAKMHHEGEVKHWYQKYARESMMGKSLQDEPQDSYAIYKECKKSSLNGINMENLGALFMRKIGVTLALKLV